VSGLEAEIDARVEFLYFHQDEAPAYDDWLANKEAEQGTVVEEVRKLVAAGESGKVEFKETLEVGGTSPEHKAAVFTASLRAICSFINKDGGTLLIGVHDTDGIVGLERDGAADAPGRDRFQQKIANGLTSRTMNYSPNLVEVQFVEVDGKWVAKVDVKPTKGATVLLDSKLYVRNLTTTVELDPMTMAYLVNVETDEPSSDG
jgi:predicted HTH transcriptional regulator